MLKSRYDAFLFDMDGLLLDSERISFLHWSAAAAEFGFSMHESLFAQMIGRPVADNEQLVKSVLGAEFPYWEVRARRVAKMEEFLRSEQIPPMAGAKSLLSELQTTAARLAVVTSTATTEAEQRLQSGDLRDYFELLIGPEAVAHGKPAPDCYLLAAERLGVSAEACLVLEDSPAGVAAGAAAGMDVVWVPDMAATTPELLSLACLHCADLVEVIEAFRSAGLLPGSR